jgi:hypothetical protein
VRIVSHDVASWPRVRTEAPSGPRTAADTGTDTPTYLRGCGVPLKTRPLDWFPDLYLQLRDADPSIEGHLSFARKYGLLSNINQEGLFEWQRRITEIREMIELISNQDKWKINNGIYVKHGLHNAADLMLGRKLGGEIELTMVPRNLYAAIYLQCVSSVATGITLRSCKACGKDFQIGGDTRQRSNRRFCSDHCRFEFNHRSRRGKS